jgi:transposase
MFLISGDSRKQIAQKLNLSEHTVSDYLKEIYRNFGVNSRAVNGGEKPWHLAGEKCVIPAFAGIESLVNDPIMLGSI